MRLSQSIAKLMCCVVLPGCAANPAGTGPPPAGAVPANDPNIQYSGRFDFTDPLAPRFDWPAVSLSAVFQGTSIGILLTDGSNDYDAFIDGVPGQVIATGSAGQYTVAGLGSGTHALQLVKRTEASYGIATFHGFVLDAGAALLPPSPAPSRRMEFVGDSLACGYGDESPSSSCTTAQTLE
jgi:hypothetical protein